MREVRITAKQMMVTARWMGILCCAVGFVVGCSDRRHAVSLKNGELDTAPPTPRASRLKVIEELQVPLPFSYSTFTSPKVSVEAQYIYEPSHLQWSSDSRFIAVNSNSAQIRIVQADTGEVKRTLSLPPDWSLLNAAGNRRLRSFDWRTESDQIIANFNRVQGELCVSAAWNTSDANGRIVEYPCNRAVLDEEMERILWIDQSSSTQTLASAPVNAKKSTFQRTLSNAQFDQYKWQPQGNAIGFVAQLGDAGKSLFEIWDIERKEKLFSQTVSGNQDFVWEETGRRLFLKTSNQIYVLDSSNGAVLHSLLKENLPQETDLNEAIAFCRFSQTLDQVIFSFEESKDQFLWNLKTGLLKKESFEDFSDAYFLHKGTILLSSNYGDQWRLWFPALPRSVILNQEHEDLEAFRIIKDSHTMGMVLSNVDGFRIERRNVSTGKLLEPPVIEPKLDASTYKFVKYPDARGVSISKNGKIYAGVARYQKKQKKAKTIAQLEFRDMSTGQLISQIPAHAGQSARSISFSKDKRILAVAKAAWSDDFGPDGWLDVWNFSKGIRFKPFHWREHAVNQAAISHDSRAIAAGGAGHVRIYNVRTMKLRKTHKLHAPWVHKVEWSPNNKYIASIASYEDEVKVWNAATGKMLRTFAGAAEEHTNIFSPNGNWILTDNNWRGVEGPFRIWHVANGKQHQSIESTGKATNVRWSHDSRFILLWNDLAEAIVRDVARGVVLDRVDFPEDAQTIITTGWHLRKPEIVFVDAQFRAFQWRFDSNQDNSMDEIRPLDYAQYQWEQNTGEPVVVRRDGGLFAIGLGDSILLRRPGSKECIILVGYSNHDGNAHLIHDNEGHAIGEEDLMGRHRLRRGFELNSQLELLQPSKDLVRQKLSRILGLVVTH